MEDWTDYPKGQYFRNVCGVFGNEKWVMALYGDLNDSSISFCECYTPRKENTNATDLC